MNRSKTALAAVKMADVATKNKSMSVVSNNTVNSLGKTKISDVCGVQSNNGLIELDHNGLSNTSNNKLITLCSPTDEDEDEDDLILANNTRNELDSQEDKSLQELIESELALRICANSGDPDDTDEDEPSEMMTSQPEITKKIILEPRQDPVDINADFIVNEIDHYTIIGEPYQYSNGHVSPVSEKPPQIVEPSDVNDDDEKHAEEEVFDGQTEVTETEITTTTSGPSLPSAYEATIELDPEGVEQEQHQLLEEDQPISVNTLSDSCVVDETTDEDSSKELSHQSVISAEKYLQEEEYTQPKDNSENLNSIDEPFQNSDDTHADLPDDIEDEDSVKINEIVDEEGKISYQENSNYDTALSSSAFLESEIKDAQTNFADRTDQEVVSPVDETFDQDEHISLKEASGVDEKACSFYSTEAESCGNIVDNDESISNRSTVDVTDYKLKADSNNQEDSWITVEEAIKESSIDIIVTQGDESLQDRTNECSDNFYSQESHFDNYLEKSKLEDDSKELAPLATPDEISDISNACDDVSLALFVINVIRKSCIFSSGILFKV